MCFYFYFFMEDEAKELLGIKKFGILTNCFTCLKWLGQLLPDEKITS